MIYPEFFPQHRKHEHAEVKIFEALKKLTHKYDIFYHKKIAAFQQIPCEIDFVVIDRYKSILLLEVKGGYITYDDSGWRTNGDPMWPVDKADSSLAKFLKHYHLTDKMMADFCLCFPDSDPQQVPDSLYPYQVISKTHLLDFETALDYAFEQSRSRLQQALSRPPHIPLESREYNQIINKIKGEIRFQIPMVSVLEAETQLANRLTEEQFTICECCLENDRLLINGVAGSGKTIVAQQIAEAYVAKKASVLMLSYNIMLGASFEKLKKKLRTKYATHQFTAAACHHFLRDIITDPHFYEAEKNLGVDKKAKENFYEWEVPGQLEKEIKEGKIANAAYDFLIIDEAQDFPETILDALFLLVKPGGKIILLRDEHQTLFQQNFIPQTESFFRLRLRKNLRNTQNIIRFINKTLQLQLDINPENPEGEKVESVSAADNKKMLQQLTDTVNHLKSKDKVSLESMLILYPEKIEQDHCLHGVSQLGNIPLKELPDNLQREADTLYYTRIKKFKGLETELLFVPNFELFREPECNNNYLYTALTRAKNRLYVFERREN